MWFFVDSGVPTLLAIVITVLLLGIVIGGMNGFLTVALGLPSLITTLATGFIIFGYVLTISAAQQVNIPQDSLGLGHWFGLDAWSEIIFAAILVPIFHVLLTRTRWGLYTISVGGNLLGAREAGIRVNRIKIGNFMISGLLGALAGSSAPSRTTSSTRAPAGTRRCSTRSPRRSSAAPPCSAAPAP